LFRAEAALELERYDEAAKEAGLAIASDPEDCDGYCVLARALHGQKKSKKALEAIDLALQKAPNVPLYHVVRSDILRALIEYDAAMAAAKECLRLAPHSPMGHLGVGLCARDLDDRACAVEAFKSAIALDPTAAQSQRLLGDAYLALERNELAEAQYRVSLSLDPNDAAALNNLGCALKALGKKHDAVMAFKAALLLDPTLEEAKSNTHATVQTLIGRAGPVGLFAGAGVLLKLGAVGLSKAPVFFALIALRLRSAAAWGGLAIAAIAVLVFVLVRQRWNRRRLERADPQIMRIYEHLEADKKAGRF
jgi:tetratricopeptide (TPR) repeat protein